MLLYKMKGHKNFLLCFRVIQDVQNVIIKPVKDPVVISSYPNCTENRKVFFFIKKQQVKLLWGRIFRESTLSLFMSLNNIENASTYIETFIQGETDNNLIKLCLKMPLICYK